MDSFTDPPPIAAEWPQQRLDIHPFDDGCTPADPAKMLQSINEICAGWYARKFRGYFAATLRGTDYVLTIFADDVHQLTGRIAEVNARRLP